MPPSLAGLSLVQTDIFRDEMVLKDVLSLFALAQLVATRGLVFKRRDGSLFMLDRGKVLGAGYLRVQSFEGHRCRNGAFPVERGYQGLAKQELLWKIVWLLHVVADWGRIQRG